MTDTPKHRVYVIEGEPGPDGKPLTMAVSYEPQHHRPHDIAARLAKQMGVKLKKGVRSKAI